MRQQCHGLVVWLLLAISTQLVPIVSGATFDRMCMHPLNHGEGVLKDGKCTATFRFRSGNLDRAFEICEKMSPFEAVEAKNGSTTTCVYERSNYFCDDYGEELIGDRCFQLRGYGRFADHKSACGDRHTIHVVLSNRELPWISYFYGGKSPEVWVGNRAGDNYYLKPKVKSSWKKKGFPKSILSQLPIKIRIATCCHDGYTKGTALYARSFEKNVFLCSRPAGVFQQGVENFARTIRHFGFPIEFGRDLYGDLRPFSILPVEHPEVQPQLADPRNLHQICTAFHNGYVASRFDFYDSKEYRRVLSKFRNVVLRTAVGRDPRTHRGRLSKAAQTIEQQWSYYDPYNGTLGVPASHWAYPRQKRPRWPFRSDVIMAVGGYVEVPIIGKYSLLCTFGNPPELRARVKNDITCDKAARFDEKTGECYCLRRESDCRLKDTAKYGHYPPGLACMSCESYAEQRSVVFMINNAVVVQEDGWKEQLKFVADILRHVENVRAAVVVISCPSYVDLPMDTYKPDELRKWASTKPYIGSSTNAVDAYRYAEMLLNAERLRSKTLVVVHNGRTTNCINGRDDSEGYAYAEQKIAINMRKAGIRIIYVSVNEYDVANVRTIAGGIQHIVNLKGYTNLSVRVGHHVMTRFCDSTVGA